jgi:hypothetical protein
VGTLEKLRRVVSGREAALFEERIAPHFDAQAAPGITRGLDEAWQRLRGGARGRDIGAVESLIDRVGRQTLTQSLEGMEGVPREAPRWRDAAAHHDVLATQQAFAALPHLGRAVGTADIQAPSLVVPVDGNREGAGSVAIAAVRGSSLRDAVAAIDLDREGAGAAEIADPIEVPARISTRGPLPREQAAAEPAPRPVSLPLPVPSMRLAAPWGGLERRIDAAQQRVDGATRRGEDPTAIVAEEDQRIETAQHTAHSQLAGQHRQQRQRQQRRRQQVQRRGAQVRRNAQRAAARRRQEAQRRHAANVARVRAELASYQQQQLARIANLRTTERQRIAAQLQAAFDAQQQAAAQERNATLARIREQHQTIVAEIERGRSLAEQTRAQRDQLLVRIAEREAASARTELAQHIANLTALGEQGVAGFHATGQHEADAIRNQAHAEAATIEATGRRLAAQAQAARTDRQGPNGATARGEARGPGPNERATARAEGRARARQILAQHAARARARIARGNADAQRTIASYEARARELLARIQRSIETARRETAQRLDLHARGHEIARGRLVAERDRWIATLELQRRAFLARAARELHQLDVHFDAQRQAAEREHRERFQSAIRALENEYEHRRAEVQRSVVARVAALQARVGTASAAELQAIERDFGLARREIDNQVARISETANREVDAFAAATQQRQERIRARGREARDAIQRMAQTARVNVAATSTTAQRTMGRREQPAMRRDNAGWEALDRDNSERYRVQNDESYRLRRYARTGEVEVTAENADTTRLALAGAVRGRNDSSRIFQTLATRTPEELAIVFADADFRAQFLSDLGSRDRAVVEQMLAARSPERVRALALQWAADGGLTGIGTDHEVMRRVFAANTTDAERAELNRQYQFVDARAASAALGQPMPGRTIDQMIVDETRWSTTSSEDRALLRAQHGGDETEIAAQETISAYRGGGYFGIGSDDDRVIAVRNDIRRRYAGPFRTAAEAQQARRDEAVAMARIDQISRQSTGRSLRELDAGETEGPVAQALAASTSTVEVPVDPTNPAGPRRTVHRPDWTQFRARVAESGAGADYDTRRIELAYGESTPDERRAINQQFARNHDGVTFEQYVQRNMGVSRRMERDGRMIETTDSHAGIDRRAATELSRDGELRSDTLVLQAQYGRGRGGEEDRAAIDRRLGTLSDGELAQLRTDYRELVSSLGMQQSDVVTRMRRALHEQRYIGIDPMARFAAWSSEQAMDTLSGPSGDILLDLRSTGTARQHRLWSYLLTNGRADTPAERLAQDNHMIAELGTAPAPGSMEYWLEGWEGRSARRHAQNLRTQYSQLEADGTARLTVDQARSELGTQLRAGRITDQEYRARMVRIGAFGAEAERSQAAQDATVAGRTATLRTAATVVGEVVTVVGGIALTVVSGGTLTAPYIAAISAAAGGLTTMGISYATLGDNYDRRDFAADAASTIVSVVAAGTIPAHSLEHFAQRMVGRMGVSPQLAREILAGAIVEAGTGPLENLATALLDERTYQGSPAEVRRHLIETVREGVVEGAIDGARDAVIADVTKRVRARGTREVPTTETPAPTTAPAPAAAAAPAPQLLLPAPPKPLLLPAPAQSAPEENSAPPPHGTV